MSNNQGLGKGKMQQIRESVAAKNQRLQFIKSLGDTELDWMGYDNVDDIINYVEWAIKNNKAGTWATRFGGNPALIKHIEGYRTAL